MEIEKICRCCLALSGPLLSIYETGSSGGGCVADMLKEIAKVKPQINDNMPEKVCLQCISEINRCYIFKIKCENSNRTLRQLLPEAIIEPLDDVPRKVCTLSTAVQTEDKIMINSLVQTMEEEKPMVSNRGIQTMEDEKPMVSNRGMQTMEEEKLLLTHREVQTEEEICAPATENKIEECINNFNEDLIVYTKNETPARKRKRCEQQSPNKKQLSPNLKQLSLEETNIQPLTPAVEQQNQQPEAYILLEDSNMDSNSQEQELFILSSGDNQQDDLESVHTEYYENEETEVTPDNDEQSAAYPDDDCIYNDEDLQTEEENNQIDSSEVVEKSNENSKSCSKKKKSRMSKPKDVYKCAHCIMTFVSVKVLRRHLTNRHNLKNPEFLLEEITPLEPVQNTSTDIEEPSSSGLELTLDNVPNPQLLPRERVTSSSLNEEMLTQAKYFCDYCQAGFALLKTLTYHMKNSICMTSNYQCSECDRNFLSQENLENHKASHHHQHKCLECQTVCKTIEDLSQHMIKEHNRNARNQCHICKKVFTMKTSLMDHLRIHSGEKPFLCTVCGKGFRQNSNLRQHLLRHTNAKNFKCAMCSNAYVTKAELFSHSRTHTGDQPFKCDECSSSYTSAGSLRKHKRKHTGERPYACELCPLRFATLNVLKNHHRTHTGEKPYKCCHCGKGFTQKGDCLSHERIHLNKVFKCFCGSKFSKRSNFIYHTKIQHRTLNAKELSKLLNKANDNSEIEITIVEDDDEDETEVGVNGGEDGQEDTCTDFVTITNENDNEEVGGDVAQNLNTSKTSNITEEIMHIVMDNVM